MLPTDPRAHWIESLVNYNCIQHPTQGKMTDFLSTFAVKSSRGGGGVLPLFGAFGPKKWGSARRRHAVFEKFCLFLEKIRRSQMGWKKILAKFWMTGGPLNVVLNTWKSWLFSLTTPYFFNFREGGGCSHFSVEGRAGVLPKSVRCEKQYRLCPVLVGMK